MQLLLRLHLLLLCAILLGSICRAEEPGFAGTESLRPYNPQSYKLGLGLGLDLPDLVPIEVMWWTKRWGTRFFFTTPISYPVRVEFPAEVVSTSQGMQIEHPELDIRLRAVHQSAGIEGFWFPWAGSFFVNSGLSLQNFRLFGSVHSPLILRPVGSQESIVTKTIFGIHADANTQNVMWRFSCGWLWRLFGRGYTRVFLAGAAVPIQSRSEIDVRVSVEAPTTDGSSVEEAMPDLKREREKEMEQSAQESVNDFTAQIWPIVGFSFGWTL